MKAVVFKMILIILFLPIIWDREGYIHDTKNLKVCSTWCINTRSNARSYTLYYNKGSLFNHFININTLIMTSSNSVLRGLVNNHNYPNFNYFGTVLSKKYYDGAAFRFRLSLCDKILHDMRFVDYLLSTSNFSLVHRALSSDPSCSHDNDSVLQHSVYSTSFNRGKFITLLSRMLVITDGAMESGNKIDIMNSSELQAYGLHQITSNTFNAIKVDDLKKIDSIVHNIYKHEKQNFNVKEDLICRGVMQCFKIMISYFSSESSELKSFPTLMIIIKTQLERQNYSISDKATILSICHDILLITYLLQISKDRSVFVQKQSNRIHPIVKLLVPLSVKQTYNRSVKSIDRANIMLAILALLLKTIIWEPYGHIKPHHKFAFERSVIARNYGKSYYKGIILNF